MEEFLTKASIAPSDDLLERYPYVGWVPTANGRLSFRHVGDTIFPQPCKYTNFVISETRYIAALQERNLSDLLFSWVTRQLTKRTGRFCFAIACSSHPENKQGLDCLVGDIFIFTKYNWKKDYGRLRSKTIDDLNAIRLKHGQEGELSNKYEMFRGNNTMFCDVSVEFKLFRDGQAHFGNPIFRDKVLETNSISHAVDRGVPFLKWMSDQAYFFLRDLCHAHQHHSPKIDTILILQEKNQSKRWINNVIYSLHYYVIRLRRSKQTEDLYRAKGVMAYAKAFIGIISASTVDNLSVPILQYEAIEMSIQARIDENNIHHLKWSQNKSWSIARTTSYRGIIVAIYALPISLVFGILSSKNSDSLSLLSSFIFKYHESLLIAMTAVFLALWFSLGEKGFIKSSYRDNTLWWKDLLTLAMFYPKTIGTISTFILIIIIVALFLT